MDLIVDQWDGKQKSDEQTAVLNHRKKKYWSYKSLWRKVRESCPGEEDWAGSRTCWSPEAEKKETLLKQGVSDWSQERGGMM